MSIFNIPSDILCRFTPEKAESLFRRIIWAEGSRVGVSRYLISSSDKINNGDGGIDVFIDYADPIIEDIIPKGMSGFQIKSSDLEPEECRKELHKEKNKEKDFKDGIRKLAEENGTYVLVLFAGISDIQKSKRKIAIEEELRKLTPSPKVRVDAIPQIQGFLDLHLSVVLQETPLNGVNAFKQWSDTKDISKPEVFFYDNDRTSIKETIRQQLLEGKDQYLFFNISGYPGVGKTRFVYEVLSQDQNRHNVQ